MEKKCKDCIHSMTIQEERTITYCNHITSVSMQVSSSYMFTDITELLNSNPAKECWYYSPKEGESNGSIQYV